MTGIAERTSTTLTARQRTSLRTHLLDDRETTLALIERTRMEMSAFVTARRDTPTDDEHDPEGPTLAFERSQSSALLGQATQHLDDIESALLRLDEGTYGVCVRCSNEIPLGRLQARPQSAHCVPCASRIR